MKLQQSFLISAKNLLFLFQRIDGCFSKLLHLIEDNYVIIAAVVLGIAALEVQKTKSPGSFHISSATSLEECCV